MSSYKYSKIFKNTYFQEMYERLFLYFRILKKTFFEKWKNGKLKTRKGQKSWKSWKNYSEFSYFQVSDFALQPKSKTRIWNYWKKISEIFEISEVSEIWTWPFLSTLDGIRSTQFRKTNRSYWFKIFCLSLFYICVHCFFLKMMKLYKDNCSAWISRTSAEFFFS